MRKRSYRKSTKTLKSISYHPTRRPPQITLDGSLSGRVVTKESATIAGTISGRILRDMYIVHDDEKIFFKSGPPAAKSDAGQTNQWTPPNDSAVSIDFKQKLKLKEGLNKILVVGRLDERIITYRSVLVSRINPNSTEVAQARDSSEDKKDAKPN